MNENSGSSTGTPGGESTRAGGPDNTRAGGPDNTRAGGPDNTRETGGTVETPPEEENIPRGAPTDTRSGRQ
jgi:hypothetical protein